MTVTLRFQFHPVGIVISMLQSFMRGFPSLLRPTLSNIAPKCFNVGALHNHEAGAVHKGGRWGVSMSTRGAKVFSTPEQIFGTWVKDVIFPQFVN